MNIKKEPLSSGENIEIVHTDTFFGEMYVDASDMIVSYRVIKDNCWEEKTVEVFSDIVKEGDIIVEVGAHIGFFTVYLSELVAESGVVYAFEPSPKNYKILRENISQFCSYDNVVTEQMVISDSSGETELFISDQSGNNSILRKTNDSINVVKTTIDNYMEKPPDILKIDVEGAEPRVFNGMTETLKYRPKIIFEYSKDWENKRETLEKLKRIGYKFYHIEGGREELTINKIISSEKHHFHVYAKAENDTDF